VPNCALNGFRFKMMQDAFGNAQQQIPVTMGFNTM